MAISMLGFVLFLQQHSAVVGAGIGGSSVAYFLQQQFGPQVQLDVYEKAVVGGRLATVTVNKQSYESGGAFFHSLNLHMEDFVQQLGLKHRREVAGKSAIFTGEQFVLEETDWYLLNLFRLWWHYGMSFRAMLLAGAQGNRWAVEGGNKLVCSGLLKLTKANIIHARVTAISLHSSEGKPLYQVHYENEDGPGSNFYDIVVIAAQLHDSKNNITFQNFDPPIAEFPGTFHTTVTSIVHGYLNSSYFGFPDPKLFPFASVLTTEAPGLFFNSMDNICPVNLSNTFKRKQPQEAAVWRVHSQHPLEKQELKMLFRSYYSVQVTEWQVCPDYGSVKNLPPIILHDSLFYLNTMEWAASSMEMSAVAARNVALLAYNRWNHDVEKIDQKDLMHKVKTEL
ncbi:hypothetical protein E2320_015574 [Naja naja]|nr:hypothetical protein E2320_015574 [Naja naja]